MIYENNFIQQLYWSFPLTPVSLSPVNGVKLLGRRQVH
jgi:hypothetical protein